MLYKQLEVERQALVVQNMISQVVSQEALVVDQELTWLIKYSLWLKAKL
jgi:hypothetical protein